MCVGTSAHINPGMLRLGVNLSCIPLVPSSYIFETGSFTWPQIIKSASSWDLPVSTTLALVLWVCTIIFELLNVNFRLKLKTSCSHGKHRTDQTLFRCPKQLFLRSALKSRDYSCHPSGWWKGNRGYPPDFTLLAFFKELSKLSTSLTYWTTGYSIQGYTQVFCPCFCLGYMSIS